MIIFYHEEKVFTALKWYLSQSGVLQRVETLNLMGGLFMQVMLAHSLVWPEQRYKKEI